MKTTVTFEIDTDHLRSVDDQYLAQLWHIAQANNAPHGDRAAGELVAHVGAEIIRRWILCVDPALYNHWPDDYAMKVLREHGRWVDGAWEPVREKVDAAMAAWNAMTEQERAAALNAAGSARPVDAMRQLGWDLPADMPPATGGEEVGHG